MKHGKLILTVLLLGVLGILKTTNNYSIPAERSVIVIGKVQAQDLYLILNDEQGRTFSYKATPVQYFMAHERTIIYVTVSEADINKDPRKDLLYIHLPKILMALVVILSLLYIFTGKKPIIKEKQ